MLTNMIKKTSYLIFSLLLVFQSCQESAPAFRAETNSEQVINDIKTWFANSNDNLALIPKNERDIDKHRVDWEHVRLLRRGHERYIATMPVISRSRTGRSVFQLVAYVDRDKIIAGFIIEVIPDRAYLKKEKNAHARDFSGQVKLLAANGKRIRTQKFVDGIEVDFYMFNKTTLRMNSGEDDWWNGGEDTWLNEVVVVGESYDPESDTYLTWVDDPWWNDYGNDWEEWSNWADDWVYEDFNNDGNMDIGIPVEMSPDVTNNVENECVNSVVANLQNSSLTNRINEVINNVFADNNNTVNLTINEDNSLNATARTQVISFDPFVVTITINSNSLVNTSQEFIAAVVYHEAIHAYLDQSGYSLSQLEQHVEIATNYIGYLQDAMLDIFPNMSTQDAIGLGLLSLHDMSIGNVGYWNNMIQEMGYSSTQALLDDTQKYLDGSGGTACPN